MVIFVYINDKRICLLFRIFDQEIFLTLKIIIGEIMKIRNNKATGIDLMTPKILKERLLYYFNTCDTTLLVLLFRNLSNVKYQSAYSPY